jgi:hypothetical protein
MKQISRHVMKAIAAGIPGTAGEQENSLGELDRLSL